MSDSGSDADEHGIRELSVLARVPTLPKELQHHIFSLCDMTSLGALCRVNKEWSTMLTPLLWGHLDFGEAFEDEQLVEAARKFFVVCDTMIDVSPERFATLASYVRTLDVGRLHGINIVREPFGGDDLAYFDEHARGSRCVFDVIARFTNLTTLSMYMKNWWGFTSIKASAEALARGLTKLVSLKLGGEMAKEVLLALFSKAEQLRHLTLINLIFMPGQDHGPDGITFLKKFEKRFSSLKTLHLCKLADLDPGESDDEEDDDSDDSSADYIKEYASGMRWRFPRETEVDVLREWASLIKHTSTNLRVLTLENRYLCGNQFDASDDFFIEPGQTHPAEYGAVSIRESQRVLFPQLSNNEWPRLKKLTLVGMGTIEDVSLAVAHLEPRVLVEQRPARIEIMGGDATPEQISTPVEFA